MPCMMRVGDAGAAFHGSTIDCRACEGVLNDVCCPASIAMHLAEVHV
jgi:hypothetical protein